MKIRILLATSLLMPTLALAGEHEHAHDSAPPHEHGAAHLTLAREQGVVRIEIDMPMADALGHEQRPSTPEQRAALMKFQREMIPHSVVIEAPGCSQVTGEASAEGGEGAHRDVHLIYQLQCPTDVKQLGFAGLFKRFPSLQRVRAEWLDDSGAGAAELTPASPALDFGQQ